MLKEEPQHFARCLRPLGVGVAAPRLPPGPGVACAFDFPKLRDAAPLGIVMAGLAETAAAPDVPDTRPRVRPGLSRRACASTASPLPGCTVVSADP